MIATTVWMWLESRQDRFGDEYPEIVVVQCDDFGDPVGSMTLCDDQDTAWDLAEKMADRNDLVLVCDLPPM